MYICVRCLRHARSANRRKRRTLLRLVDQARTPCSAQRISLHCIKGSLSANDDDTSGNLGPTAAGCHHPRPHIQHRKHAKAATRAKSIPGHKESKAHPETRAKRKRAAPLFWFGYKTTCEYTPSKKRWGRNAVCTAVINILSEQEQTASFRPLFHISKGSLNYILNNHGAECFKNHGEALNVQLEIRLLLTFISDDLLFSCFNVSRNSAYCLYIGRLVYKSVIMQVFI